MSLSSTLKRRITTTVLVILVMVLASLVYLQLQKEQAGAETLYHKNIGESVQRVTISLPGKADIIIEVLNEGSAEVWTITQPIVAKASKQALEQLLTLLGEPVLASYTAAGKDLNTFGLAESAVRLRFNTVEYRLGKLNPVNHRRYVLLNEDIFLVNEAVYELLRRGVDGFKEKVDANT